METRSPLDGDSDDKSTKQSAETASEYLNVSSWWLHMAPQTQQTSNNTLPVSVLGKVFHTQAEFEKEINRKVFLSYRYGFDPIPRAKDGPSPLSFVPALMFNKGTMLNSFKNLADLVDSDNFSSDVGWGCMIRTSQSLVANSYLCILQSRPGFSGGTEDLVAMFHDSASAPYSLCNMINAASTLPLQVKPGQWFGPAAASLSLKRLCDKLRQNPTPPLVPDLSIIISESGDLYDDAVTEELTVDQSSDGLLLLLPVRLGIDKINDYYKESLIDLISLQQSSGIAGGKPCSSYYFLGCSGDDFIYLDPHSPQPHLDKIDVDSYHTTAYLKIPFSSLDPSMLIGITIKNIDDYLEFKNQCQESNNKIVHFHSRRGGSSCGLVSDSFMDDLDKSDTREADSFAFVSAQECNPNQNPEEFVDLGGSSGSNNKIGSSSSIGGANALMEDSSTSFHVIQDCSKDLEEPILLTGEELERGEDSGRVD